MQQQQQMIQQYRSYTDAATKRILIVNYDDDVNFALKIVLEEERREETRGIISKLIPLTILFRH